MTLMIRDIRTKINRLKGQRDYINSVIDNNETKLKMYQAELKNHEHALEIIKQVGLSTQQQLEFQISDLTSLALSAVFEDPYELKVEFTQRRGQTECDLYFVRDEKQQDPMNSTGHGVVDVASFALRIASWSIEKPRKRAVIILDEPFKHLSEDNQERASKMISKLSKKLKLQFIIVTHEQTLAEHGDRIFKIMKRKNQYSSIKQI